MSKSPGYAVIGIYPPGQDTPSLLAKNGQVLIFDTPAMARQFAPLLGEGRLEFWSDDREEVFFSPVLPNGVNRAVILTGYDVYNLPPGLPVRSEARGRDWKHHIHWGQAYFEGDAGSSAFIAGL